MLILPLTSNFFPKITANHFLHFPNTFLSNRIFYLINLVILQYSNPIVINYSNHQYSTRYFNIIPFAHFHNPNSKSFF